MFLFISFFFFFISFFFILPTQKKNWGLTSDYCAGQVCHSGSLPFTPWTPQGGGSLSVLLTLYKAGGTCFPRLIFFLILFMMHKWLIFKKKKIRNVLAQSTSFDPRSKWISYAAPVSSTPLHGCSASKRAFRFSFVFYMISSIPIQGNTTVPV